MSLWKISKAPERWVAAELVLALSIMVAPLTAHEVYEQRAEHAQRASTHEQRAPPIATADEHSPAEVGKGKPTKEEHAESGPLGFSPEEWIAIFTVVLAIATIALCAATFFLWLETRNIRRDSEKGLRALERAYIFAGVNTDRITRQEVLFRWNIPIKIHNIGKTPGFVRDIIVRIEPADFVPTGEPKYVRVENQVADFDVAMGGGDDTHLDDVHSDAARFVCFGVVRYDDIFGISHESRFCQLVSVSPVGCQIIGPRSWNRWT